MAAFDLHEPTTVDEAVALLERLGDDATILAGGTSVVLLLGQGLIEPAHVVGLRHLDELRDVRGTPDGGLEIGALASLRSLERDPAIAAYEPMLAAALGAVATVRIRNQATLGGNLAHADPAQDPPPALLVLGAEVVVRGSAGERTVPLDAFFVDVFETALLPGDVLTHVRLPPRAPGARAAYRKFLPRTREDYATVSVAVSLRLDDGGARPRDVRIALGAVGATPIRARAVERVLEGASDALPRLAEIAALVRDEVEPADDLRGSAEWKRDMARVWTERALRDLLTAGAGTPHAAAA